MYRLLSSIAPLVLPTSVCAHQFAAYGGNQIPFWAHSDAAVDEIDLSTYDFGGIGSYAHVPMADCFVKDDSSEPFDIAILGAPFDTVRSSIRLSKCRFMLKPLDVGCHGKTRCEVRAECHSKRQSAQGIWLQHLYW